MKYGFYITGKKGFDVLIKLKDRKPIFVVSYDDKNTNDNSYDLIKKYCTSNNIEYYDKDMLPDYLFNHVDKIFILGWQFLIKGDLDKVVVIHDSLLPEYKGWAPTVNYLINGSEYLGATAFKPTEVVDTGPIYSQKRRYIKYPLKIEKALEIVSDIYLEIILDIIDNNPTTQNMLGMETFCSWRDKEDYQIDWSMGAQEIERFVDAVGYPYTGAKFYMGSDTLTLIDSKVCVEMNIIQREKHIGKVIKIEGGIPYIICGDGILKLNKIEDETGNRFIIKKLKTRLK